MIVPCSPTLSIKLAINCPISTSPLAEIVATFWTCSLDFTYLEIDLSSFTITSTAKLIPFLISVGLSPAATLLHPSLKIALVKMAAVVVPSPTSSFVLEETYFTKFAPIFINLSVNSILLATVTPFRKI